jgi:hypothetical protein
VRRREATQTGSHAVAGFARPGFEAVRDAFVENFERRGELGAACCVYHRGEKVVDLWGGIRNEATGEPWEEDTMALVHSTTKGMAGLAMALAHSRGLFDHDGRVSTYWPEFAQQGKGRITVRQLLSHQAGLFALDERPVRSLVADPDRLAAVLARQRPAWTRTSAVDRIRPPDLFRRFRGGDVEVHHDGLLSAPDHDARERLVTTRVDLLMWDERRHEDEVAGTGLRDELEPFAPPHSSTTAHDVDDALQLAVVVGARLRVCVDRHGARPQLLRADPGIADRGRAGHAGRLGRVEIELARADDPDPIISPSGARCRGAHPRPPRRRPVAGTASLRWITANAGGGTPPLVRVRERPRALAQARP